ncbi:Fic family protein [Synechococcus sp. PCC 6312]|uniref:Fic family protein n=1 Tax=Synechococcus sp. (strain ATCC 27167 / PCC 6312) TaxID=195253 RepID=UPI00059C873B|nr:Fic family protein [Synechococcus sp. PCC 6312]
MTAYTSLGSLSPRQFETVAILKKLATTSRKLAELKGIAGTIPNQSILINTLALQEAKDSSAIENIITTHDELFKDDLLPDDQHSLAGKEVLRYREALRVGFEAVQATGLLTLNHILNIQATLEHNRAGFRKVPSTVLKDNFGHVVYAPPPPDVVPEMMGELERFMNEEPIFITDPLIKMAIIHHQFESIHPFYDGNGRTGRIINVLYLVKEGLLDIPVLYLSRSIVRTKADYYCLLQRVRDKNLWEDWILYMLTAVEETATQTIETILAIKALLLEMKHHIRKQYKFYSQDLINNLFKHPYTKIEFVQRDLNVTRLTATKYLNELVSGGFLEKRKIGRSNFYINTALYQILTGESL